MRIDEEHFGLGVRVEFAALVERFEHVDFVAQPGRPFELQVLRRRPAFPRAFAVSSVCLLAAEKHLQTVDVAAVFLLADPQIARRRALIDAGQQAGPEPPPPLVPFGDVQAAGAELEDPLQHLHRAAQRSGAGERPVQLDAPVSRLARDFHARKVLAGRDHQVGKRLVVLLFPVVLAAGCP